MHFKSLASALLLGQSALVGAQQPSGTTSSPAASATCEPHGDHWHCPKGVPQPELNPDGKPNPKFDKEKKECEPHGDHWHCPEGVPQPEKNPDGSPNPKADHDDDHDHDHDDHDDDHDHDHGDGKQCTPHGDHWHCPEGVEEPDHPPPATSTGVTPTASASQTGSPTGASAAPTSAGTSLMAPLGLAAVIAAVFGVMMA